MFPRCCSAPCCFVLKTVLMIAMTIRGGETQPPGFPSRGAKQGPGTRAVRTAAIIISTVWPLHWRPCLLWQFLLGTFRTFGFRTKILNRGGSFWFQFFCPAESPLGNCSIMTAWRLDTCLNCSAHSATATLAINHNTNFSDLNLILYITFSTSTLFWLFPNAWGIIKLMFSALRIWRW